MNNVLCVDDVKTFFNKFDFVAVKSFLLDTNDESFDCHLQLINNQVDYLNKGLDSARKFINANTTWSDIAIVTFEGFDGVWWTLDILGGLFEFNSETQAFEKVAGFETYAEDVNVWCDYVGSQVLTVMRYAHEVTQNLENALYASDTSVMIDYYHRMIRDFEVVLTANFTQWSVIKHLQTPNFGGVEVSAADVLNIADAALTVT